MMTGPSVRRSPSVRKGSSSEGGSEGEEGPCQPASLVHFWRRQTSAPDPQARAEVRVIAREENQKEEGQMLHRGCCMARDGNTCVSCLCTHYPHLLLLKEIIFNPD